MPHRLELAQGDLTTFAVDAIVNAANETLLGGGGVDGAIHAAAGPELLEACRPLGGCAPGEAKVTPGYRLPARAVIHTVGPRWHGGDRGEAETLAACYRNSLARAVEHGFRSVAFPAISTGVFGFPPLPAARIAVETVGSVLEAHPDAFDRVVLVSFGAEDLEIARIAAEEVLGPR